MALMNIVSSNINQWTVLAAMIPLVYGYSHLHHHGSWSAFPFDPAQRIEIVLTLLQTALGVLLLANMEFDWLDASTLLVLWLAQFLVPHWREEVAIAYGAWMVILVGQYTCRRPEIPGVALFSRDGEERGTEQEDAEANGTDGPLNTSGRHRLRGPADRVPQERRGLLKPESNDWSLTGASVFPLAGA